MLGLIHWALGLMLFSISLMMFSKVLKHSGCLKRMLIKKRDRIEYADPNAHDGKDIFKKAEVIVKMRLSEVEKTKLISQELMQGNEHFYLVKVGKDVSVIAYDWIIGISPELLDMEFDFEKEK
nr:hypothetical protein [Sulfurimonas sp. MAG313]